MQAGHSPLPIAAEDQRDQSGDQWGLQLNLKHPYPGSLWLILPQAPRHPTTRDSAWDKMRVQDEHHQQVGPLPTQGSGNSFGLAPALTKPPQFSHCDLRVPTDFLLQLLPGEQVQHRLRYHTEQPSTHGCDLGGAQEGSRITTVGLSPGQPRRAPGAGTAGPQRVCPGLMDILGMGCTEELPSWSWFWRHVFTATNPTGTRSACHSSRVPLEPCWPWRTALPAPCSPPAEPSAPGG